MRNTNSLLLSCLLSPLLSPFSFTLVNLKKKNKLASDKQDKMNKYLTRFMFMNHVKCIASVLKFELWLVRSLLETSAESLPCKSLHHVEVES